MIEFEEEDDLPEARIMGSDPSQLGPRSGDKMGGDDFLPSGEAHAALAFMPKSGEEEEEEEEESVPAQVLVDARAAAEVEEGLKRLRQNWPREETAIKVNATE